MFGLKVAMLRLESAFVRFVCLVVGQSVYGINCSPYSLTSSTHQIFITTRSIHFASDGILLCFIFHLVLSHSSLLSFESFHSWIFSSLFHFHHNHFALDHFYKPKMKKKRHNNNKHLTKMNMNKGCLNSIKDRQ